MLIFLGAYLVGTVAFYAYLFRTAQPDPHGDDDAADVSTGEIQGPVRRPLPQSRRRQPG